MKHLKMMGAVLALKKATSKAISPQCNDQEEKYFNEGANTKNFKSCTRSGKGNAKK